MEFLPLERDGKKVYAGFWKRLSAGIIDFLLWLPLLIIFHYIQSISIMTAIIAAIVFSLLFSVYSVVFNLKYGGTLGKLAVGIRVTKPNGEKISPENALLRSSVDIVFSVFFAISQVSAIGMVDTEAYLSAGFIERSNLILPLIPAYGVYANILSNYWYWSEMIVLLFNKRKRALHDFIAGTAVINKESELVVGSVGHSGQCPNCSGEIIEEAVKCKHCGAWLKSYAEIVNDKARDNNPDLFPILLGIPMILILNFMFGYYQVPTLIIDKGLSLGVEAIYVKAGYATGIFLLYGILIPAPLAVFSLMFKKRRNFNSFLHISFYILIVTLALNGVIGFMLTPYALEGKSYENFLLVKTGYKNVSGSMVPTLLIGDHLYVSLNNDNNLRYQKGDIVVLEDPQKPGKEYVKRIIGVGGDTIKIVDNKLYINSSLIDEPYAVFNDHKSGKAKKDNFGPFAVPKNSYFVLGDNRDFSYDSRFFGAISINQIKGKATKIYYSWDDENGTVRWSRIGMDID